MSVRVSYVVATRNRASFIKAALPMWKELKGPQDELIVVDGNSTDGTYELLRGAEPGLVDLLVHEKDLSEAHAFNKGFLNSRGELIKGLTDDDLFFREPLEQAYKVMGEHPEIDVLITGGESVDTTREESGAARRLQWFPSDADLKGEHAYIGMIGLGVIIRRSSLAITGLFDPRHLHADTSFLTQATVRGANIRYIRVNAFRHQFGTQSLSQHSVRKTYIYQDFNFRALSRWRYLRNPRKALRWAFQRLGWTPDPAKPKNPVWDGALI